MMQFFYEREVIVGKSEDGTTDLKETRKDSFNPEHVVRSYEYEKGRIYLMLNDGHEESKEIPIINKRKQITGYKKERQWVVSEILLNEADTKKYRAFFDIEPHMLLQNDQVLNTLEAVKTMNEPSTTETE